VWVAIRPANGIQLEAAAQSPFASLDAANAHISQRGNSTN
jgi:hypothetical protein